ncbi:MULTISPECIES: acyl carrier protein [Rhodococcus]|jgi:acyl carrier protein|uniref:acyl carrier protein n=1 Tax=Rhodococcus TaxID=1827 RepID=UPI001AEA60DF|nr:MULTISPECIES: acyl carrier protein [Rhodococcus]MBP1161510.1 acyl carrier protein [Rhodococcus sp. PvR099]MCZ4555844.1 acyl carrier protein [Rhodococcus maanshanensis]
MSNTISTPTAAALAPITRWLVERVAGYLDVPARDIDPTTPLAEIGIDSVSALSLCGDVEERWRIPADATLVFDYPTIAEIAGYLADELAPKAAAS